MKKVLFLLAAILLTASSSTFAQGYVSKYESFEFIKGGVSIELQNYNFFTFTIKAKKGVSIAVGPILVNGENADFRVKSRANTTEYTVKVPKGARTRVGKQFEVAITVYAGGLLMAAKLPSANIVSGGLLSRTSLLAEDIISGNIWMRDVFAKPGTPGGPGGPGGADPTVIIIRYP